MLKRLLNNRSLEEGLSVAARMCSQMFVIRSPFLIMWNFCMKFHEPNTIAVPCESLCNVYSLLEPDNQNAKNNAAFFERTIKSRKVKPKTTKERAEYMVIYSSLCRGENSKVRERCSST